MPGLVLEVDERHPSRRRRPLAVDDRTGDEDAGPAGNGAEPDRGDGAEPGEQVAAVRDEVPVGREAERPQVRRGLLPLADRGERRRVGVARDAFEPVRAGLRHRTGRPQRATAVEPERAEGARGREALGLGAGQVGAVDHVDHRGVRRLRCDPFRRLLRHRPHRRQAETYGAGAVDMGLRP